jgi:hypothetical protein
MTVEKWRRIRKKVKDGSLRGKPVWRFFWRTGDEELW